MRFKLFWVILLLGGIFPGLQLASPPITLAVLDFQNTSGTPELDYLQKAIPQILVTDLIGAKKLTLIERSKLEQILKEHQLHLTGVIDDQTAIKIGKLIGANHLLYGTIFKVNTHLRLDASVCETETGKIIAAEKVESSENTDEIDLIDELARRILQKLTQETLPDMPPDTNWPTFQPVSDAVLAAQIDLDNQYKLLQAPEANYLLAQFKAGKVLRQTERIPLNICMVIDQSGSMSSENKLEKVKQAAQFVIEHLTANDFFSLVSYDSDVYTQIPGAQVKNKAALREIIEKIQPGSSTNLSGGLMEGYAEVMKNFQRGRVNRVLLLTDGLANAGITNPQQLTHLASEKNSHGLTLSTFGVGSDFNEDLLTNLAEYGGANYYFISDPEQIAAIFQSELQGLLAVVAQNVKLRIKPAPEVALLQVFGYPTQAQGNETLIKLNDFFSEEEKSILFKLQIPAQAVGGQAVAEVKLTYDDVILKNERVENTFSKSIQITTDPSLVEKYRLPLVFENVALYESVQMLDAAITQVDQRNFEQAQSMLAKNISYLESNVAPGTSKRLKRQVLNVYKYEAETQKADQTDAKELKESQKQMKFNNYIQKKKK
ncbi:VWA domain-containing protein [candidate division KSB1 bacterium]|nr:VWA domain-containing protein [candidate division KSB1 bacterium]